jgi:hypothetical protein
LYIPSPFLVFNFGNRLGVIAKQKDIWWEYEKAKEEEIMAEILFMMSSYGVPFLEERNKLEKFLSKYGKIGLDDNPNMVEGICYTHVLIGDYPKARIILSSFNRILMKEIEKRPKIEWIVKMNVRVRLILDYLENQNFTKAKEQLEEWRNYTVEKLGISDVKTN